MAVFFRNAGPFSFPVCFAVLELFTLSRKVAMQKWVMEKLSYLPKKSQEKFYERLREKALLRTRARLVESGTDIDTLSDEELEVIIADEEDKLIGEYKSKGLIALLALLGISWF
jgi:hypothetical protein